MGDFFNFRKMVTPLLIKVLYVIGIIVISLWYVDNFAQSIRYSVDLLDLIFLVIIFIIGQIAWRMICEGIILFFSVHDELVKMNEKMEYSTNTGFEISSALTKLRDINQTSGHTDGWICGICGFKNPPSNTYCTACKYTGRNSPAKNPASATNQIDAWKCAVCGYLNNNSQVCLQCGENKREHGKRHL